MASWWDRLWENTKRGKMQKRREERRNENKSADKKRKASELTRTPTKERQQEIAREKARERYGADELESRAKKDSGGTDSPRARLKPKSDSKGRSDKKERSDSKDYTKGVSDGGVPFKEAFAHFRKKGVDTFTWNGKKYTTELKKTKKDTAKSEEKSEFRKSNKGAASEKGLYNKGGMVKKRNTIGASMKPSRSMKNGKMDYRGK